MRMSLHLQYYLTMHLDKGKDKAVPVIHLTDHHAMRRIVGVEV